METQYYYKEAGGEIRGPLNLGSLKAASQVGELSAHVWLSEQGKEPWTTLEEVLRRGHAAFVPGQPGRRQSMAAQAKTYTDEEGRGVGPLLYFFGGACAVISCVPLVIGVIMSMSDQPGGLALGMTSLSGILIGLLVMGAGEALGKLREIVALLRQK